jgi:hypothetical protein
MLVSVLIFTVVLIACAGVAARALARTGRQLARTGAEFERLGGRLEDRFLPRVEVVLERATITLRELESTADQARSGGRHFEEVLASLGDITVMVEDAVQPFVAAAASVGVDRRRVRAIRAGFGAMFGRLFGRPPGRSSDRQAGESAGRPADPGFVLPADRGV